MALAIEVTKAAQPVRVNIDGADSDVPDDAAVVETQPSMPVVEVAAHAAVHATTGTGGVPTFDEEGPVWPDEAAESAMRVEVAGRGETLSSQSARVALQAAAEAAEEKKNLPPLDELIAKIPEAVRDVLEDQLRVKWTKVARAPKQSLRE